MHVTTIETPELGARSYVVHDGEVALVIDPQRDIDRVEKVLADAGVRLTLVAETHLHNDYVSGGLELARRHHASYVVNAADAVAFAHHAVTDCDEFAVGELTVLVLATPGHTETHLAYVVSSGIGRAVFSGGSLLFGSVGRTDLVGPARTEQLTRAQFRSARRLADAAGNGAILHPTHGFGGFCAAGPGAGDDRPTIGVQRAVNPALRDDEQTFVEGLIAGLTQYPAYYTQIGPLNRAGAGPVDLTVRAVLEPAELRGRIAAGKWVVDLRHRTSFARGHLPGTVNIEHDPRFATELGWTLPWGSEVTLLGPRERVHAAVRDLARIGIEPPAAAIGDDPAALANDLPLLSYPVAGWAEVADARSRGQLDTLLDVRRNDEYAAGHIDGAVGIALHELRNRCSELAGGRVWVHCATGYRAAIGAAIVHRAGREVVLVDDRYPRAVAAGMMVVP